MRWRASYNSRNLPMVPPMFRRLISLPFRFVRPTAAVTLAAFLLASVGYPLWSGGQSKDLSQAFPCMYRECGCRNAEQCWRGCCCFTGQQKLAWAEENNVTPPDYVVAAAQRETERSSKSSCCSAKQGDCSKPATIVKSAVVKDAADSLTAVIDALTCLNQLDQWVALGAIDVVRTQPWQLEWPLSGRVYIATFSHSAVGEAPAPPPPWC